VSHSRLDTLLLTSRTASPLHPVLLSFSLFSVALSTSTIYMQSHTHTHKKKKQLMSSADEPKPPFEMLKRAAIGTYWSNRSKDGKHFKNYGVAAPPSSGGVKALKWMVSKMCSSNAKPKDGYEGFGKVWYAPCNMGESVAKWRHTSAEQLTDRVYFIGHATQLLCLANGVNILFDPIFSKRASPVSFSGPARRYPPATTVEQLPPIHIVTVSHNHYDHMDKASLVAVAQRFPEARFVLPLKMERFLLEWGIPATSITTLDWYEECELHAVRIGCTPAQHWGRHSLTDGNEVLWCGWCVGWKRGGGKSGAPAAASPTTTTEGNKDTPASYSGSEVAPPAFSTPAAAQQSWSEYKKYFFTGDTAYNVDVSTSIYNHFGPMDMAGLPIGAYSPRWFMSRAHVDPEHAVQIFQDQDIQKAMAVHWATFELADEPLDEPPEVLAEALKAAGIDAKRFQAIPMGKFIDF
jgi:N-acyl-phosphatidylethanolamine-hydrolysing phospholipase D